MRRPCLDCGTLTTGSRCPTHTRARDRARGTTTARGYGAAHQAMRNALRDTLPSPCGYCPRVVLPGTRWVAAHRVDGHPEYGYLVAHADCNERAKGTGSSEVGNAPRCMTRA